MGVTRGLIMDRENLAAFKARRDKVENWEDYHRLERSLNRLYTNYVFNEKEYDHAFRLLDTKFRQLVEQTGGYEKSVLREE